MNATTVSRVAPTEWIVRNGKDKSFDSGARLLKPQECDFGHCNTERVNAAESDTDDIYAHPISKIMRKGAIVHTSKQEPIATTPLREVTPLDRTRRPIRDIDRLMLYQL